MPNFTIEDYKEAIRAKYEKDINNPLSDSLTSLGQAYLRDFCWEKFESELSDDDKRVFASFFGCDFNSITRNLFREKTDKFRPIGTFLKRETDLTSKDAVNLTAILIDFQHRPFSKFREKGIINYLKHPEDSKITESIVEEEEDTDIVIEEEKDNDEPIKSPVPLPFVTTDNTTKQTKEKEKGEDNENDELSPKYKSRLEKIREKILANFRRKLLITTIVVGALFVSIIISASFFKKDCMVWVNDHYEERDRSEQGDCDVYYDERYFDLKKIKVCESTTFFKNGKPIVWYFRSGDSIEYFDRFAPYPENTNKYLKPITNYMIKTHIEGKPCK